MKPLDFSLQHPMASTNVNLTANRQPTLNNLSPSSFIPNSSGLSPAAFFNPGLKCTSVSGTQYISLKPTPPAKPLTSSEINDFLN